MSGQASAPPSVPPLTSMPPTARESQEIAKEDGRRPCLFCAICLFSAEMAQEADTVINGQAVCLDHAGYVQGGEFTRAIALVKREQPQ